MPVVIAVLVALLWVFALRRWYRQAPTPLESVEHQQRALDALQHAASRARIPTSPGPTSRPAPMPPLHGGRPQRSWAPLVVAMAGTLLLVGVGAIWWVGRSSTNDQSAISATSPTTRARRPASTTTTTTAPPTTTTTAPIAHATITNQTSSSIVFAVDKPTFTVTIAATAPCWVRATAPTATASSTSTSTSGSNSSSGSSSQTTVFEKTLQSGDTQPIPAVGALQLRLGAANNVTIALDGQPVTLPTPVRNTLSLTFNGSTNGA
ncbi:MAG TPA: RodZ domain-containing protein [Acidimicrobiia bacterium]